MPQDPIIPLGFTKVVIAMFLHLQNVLTDAEVERLRQLADNLEFIDGKATNQGLKAKNNLQVDHNNPAQSEPGEIVRAALFRSPQVREFAFPNRLARPTLSKYEPGMYYGRHVDASLFPSQPSPMRSDVSCTVFISDPADYDGGELTVNLGDQMIQAKGDPGSAVFYPSTSIHEVTEVTRGVRLVAVAWMQSYIQDAHQRELLHALNQIAAEDGPKLSEESQVRIQSLKNNLFRMWSKV